MEFRLIRSTRNFSRVYTSHEALSDIELHTKVHFNL
jgi:hypothetical protein